MSPELVRAVVLRTRPFSETSLWVRLYTESHGKITGIAKGARKGTERIFTPFLEVECNGYPPRGAEHGLWTLARPEVNTDWRALVSDPDSLPYAFSLLELVECTVEEMHPQPELYSALTTALVRMSLAKAAETPTLLFWFALALIDALGFALQHEICPRCGRPLVFPVGTLVSSAGGVLCKACSPPGTKALSQDVWELLVTLSDEAQPGLYTVSMETRDAFIGLLLAYLSYHCERPVRLKSLGLLADYRSHGS
jgi:DNA repair protein RecO (recombination protein O)